jgi:rhodanese-related sulfurtransferase/AcrR family transcriptional regulator
MTAKPVTQPARRGRPRSEKARQAILDAAAELLLVHGLGSVSMDAVAERAGVSKATIYRWWPTKETLALDALHLEWSGAHPPVRGTGPLRADLISVMRPWVTLVAARPYGRVLAALLAEAHADPGFAEEYRARFIGPRREESRGLVRGAIERGEIPADTDVELALDLLWGPLYHRLLHGHATLDEGFLGRVVDAVLAGVVPTQSPAHSPELGLRPVTADDALALQRQGAQILDTRDPSDFARAHLAGAVNVGLAGDAYDASDVESGHPSRAGDDGPGGSYATWCDAVLDRECAVVIVADPGREQEAAARLHEIGFEFVGGYVEGGMQTLDAFHDRLVCVPRVTAAALAEQLESHEPPLVVDVRAEWEWRASCIPASVNIPLTRITQRLNELPSDRPLVVHCATGYRSAIASSLLLRDGFGTVADLAGGIAAWQSLVLATVS